MGRRFVGWASHVAYPVQEHAIAAVRTRDLSSHEVTEPGELFDAMEEMALVRSEKVCAGEDRSEESSQRLLRSAGRIRERRGQGCGGLDLRRAVHTRCEGVDIDEAERRIDRGCGVSAGAFRST